MTIDLAAVTSELDGLLKRIDVQAPALRQTLLVGLEDRVRAGILLRQVRQQHPSRGPTSRSWGEYVAARGISQDTASRWMKMAERVLADDRAGVLPLGELCAELQLKMSLPLHAGDSKAPAAATPARVVLFPGSPEADVVQDKPVPRATPAPSEQKRAAPAPASPPAPKTAPVTVRPVTPTPAAPATLASGVVPAQTPPPGQREPQRPDPEIELDDDDTLATELGAIAKGVRGITKMWPFARARVSAYLRTLADEVERP